jgi:hypothetical protein
MRNIWSNLIFLVIAGALMLPGLPVAAKGPPVSISADYVEVADGVASRGKYYAGPEGIRMEGEFDGEPGITIVNFSRNVIWTVEGEERMYIEMPFEPEKVGTITSPCADLEMTGQLQKATRVGRETLDGRKVEKWHCESQDGVDAVWFDDRLKTVVRSRDHDGDSFTLRNIRETRLSGDLFQPPAGYTKMAMPGASFPGGGFKGMDPRTGMEGPGGAEEDGGGLMEGLRGLLGR